MAMRIRELAAQAETTTRALRYYEAQGLLPAGRSANGYRVYDEHHVRLVREIRSLQAIGFSLTDGTERSFPRWSVPVRNAACSPSSARSWSRPAHPRVTAGAAPIPRGR